ncbi:hypothetical protein EIN_229650 [Entamoeba invadens IP1]|uniref:Uncharacterized protein n=1 Tax=Entamoeba invadens IP1 TaxID=370355 RepID=A0A0A1U305_ENTIV|nr:hypothetical protein EIN_229650 [Entamoeba invadens IP1]ELP88432.1 hypothetical protein EIN_229650 [Entamoeba invadens IP1]|eukprot:XP_004255203.1 hypothetical protein EIN_229650 [Entamoeba invadens IP1]
MEKQLVEVSVAKSSESCVIGQKETDLALEALGNVIRYLANFKEAETFAQISKKCGNALNFVFRSPNYSAPQINLKYPRNVFWQQKSFARELSLFPKLRVFDIYGNAPQMQLVMATNKDVQIAAKSYKMKNELPDIDKDEKKRFIELWFCGDDPLKLIQFKNLQKAKIRLLKDQKVCKFVLKKQQLEVLHVIFTDGVDDTFLSKIKEYHINKLVIECEKKEDLEHVLSQLELFKPPTNMIVCSTDDINNSNVLIIPKRIEKVEEVEEVTGERIVEEMDDKNVSNYTNEFALKVMKLQANAEFHLKSLNVMRLNLVDCCIDTAVDLNDFYPRNLMDLTCKECALPLVSTTLKKVTIQEATQKLDLSKLSILEECVLDKCKVTNDKDYLILPRKCKLLTMKRPEGSEVNLEVLNSVDELILDSVEKIQITLPQYLLCLIIYKSRYFSLTNAEKVHMKRLALVKSELVFFDINKVVEDLDQVVFK